MCTISRNNLKRHYLKNKRLFADFLFHFWNLHEIYNILKKKRSILAQLFQKLWTAKRGGYLNV